MTKIISTLFLVFYLSISGIAQKLPRQMQLSSDGRMLTTGQKANNSFYNQNSIPILYLNFSDTANFWQDMILYHDSLKDYPATLIYNGVTYDSVGVRFKGNSSYENIGNSLKKSFNISLNAFIEGQGINGYNTLNLNNCYDDPSFMREVFFENQIKQHIPAAQTNFAHLYINGADWGLYANVQQLNRDFQKEWFMSDEGANFRASRPPGSTGSGSVIKASFLNLGQDTAEYQKFYTLKSSETIDPWTKLKDFCTALDTIAPARKVAALSQYLDIDRALWFLASEIAFNDFDSYIEKGKNDFYVYYEKETGRFAPLEFDGNDVMDTHYVNAVSALRHTTDTLFPLMSKIIGVPEIRQRYLAHMRTLVADEQDTTSAFPWIDNAFSMIDSIVFADTIKLYSYAAFQNSPGILKYYLRNRRLKMLNNSEVDNVGPIITDVRLYSDSLLWKQPEANHAVQIRAQINSGNGISKVILHSATGLVGNFNKTQMFDDGLHNDSLAGDGIYAATLVGQSGGTWVRYYVEAASNNTAKTVSFEPPGAEHNIFIYLVKPAIAADSTSIVINEIMARNNTTVTDSAGQYEDWIELYNNSNQAVDISGYYLTDNEFNLTKWQIPQGTILNANEYLIIWADEDGAQGNLHANFKFSANGETLIILNAQGELVNKISFGPQSPDISYARIPNGNGPFAAQFPTFGINNNPKPQVGFFTSITNGCGTANVSFFNTSVNASDYVWDFGDNSPTSTAVNPTHIYTSPGNFTVTLQANGGGWTVIDSLPNSVQVNPLPVFDFGVDTIYAPSVNYLLEAGNGFTSYSWNTGDLTQGILLSTSGNYCVVVGDVNGCTDTACVYLKFPLALPQASYTANNTQGCAALYVSFTNTSINGVNYIWDFGDASPISTDENPEHAFNGAGIYNVSLSAINAIDTSVFISSISVFPNPVFSFASDTIHAPNATLLLDAGTGFTSYAWNTGEITQAITVDSNANYCVVVMNQFACADTDCVYITVNGLGLNSMNEEVLQTLFPNPASDFVLLSSSSAKNEKIEIYSAQGALVYRSHFTAQIRIETNNWAEGIYLVKNGEHNFRKLVIQR
ncbi:MAG: CotH kinase family protein [Bacteroidetes bacterium]|nr:CotH kinase family protein [Bacteroidota bacterium]